MDPLSTSASITSLLITLKFLSVEKTLVLFRGGQTPLATQQAYFNQLIANFTAAQPGLPGPTNLSIRPSYLAQPGSDLTRLYDAIDARTRDIVDVRTQLPAAPHWFNFDFLFAINYGGGDAAVLNNFRKIGLQVDDLYTCLLLLPPKIIDDFSAALFVQPPYTHFNQIEKPRRPVESVILLTAIRFISMCVCDLNYSSEILGSNSRPPLHDIFHDIGLLAGYLAGISNATAEKLSDVLLHFLEHNQLRSIVGDNVTDTKVRGLCVDYMADIFKVICWSKSTIEDILYWQMADGWDSNRQQATGPQILPRWYDNIKYPGTDYLLFGQRKWLRESTTPESDKTLDDLEASFICSGPYTFTLATEVGEHLTLSGRREIRLYCGGLHDFKFSDKSNTSFGLLENHKLGRQGPTETVLTFSALGAKEVETEIGATLELLFTRRHESMRLLSALISKWDLRFNLYLLYQRLFTKFVKEDPLSLATALAVGALDTSYGKQIIAAALAALAVSPNAQTKIRDDKFPLNQKMATRILLSPSPSLFKFGSNLPIAGEFPIYGRHLLHLSKQMQEWKPRSLGDLLIAAYRDRLAWFTAVFGLVFGFLGLFALFMGILQTAVGIVTLQATWETIKLQKQQMNITVN